ncbi:MAG: agmatinase [Methanotrichaceae archaeon]|nr:agmatinase [Methanotrichaceae archaeon]
MFQRCGFADADADLEGANYVVVGLPFDCTASFRSGSRDGPDAIRLASFNFESYDPFYDVDLAELAICDLGNMELGADPVYAKETIKEGIALLPKAAIPIFLGGEHSITPPIVESLARLRAPEGLGVLVLDAHLDLREEYGCTRYSHACASRRILEKKGVKSYASIGIRSGSKEEFSFAKENGISYFNALEVKEKGIDYVLDRALKSLNCEQIYLSIDLDALDPAFAPAVGNPEPFGITAWDVKRVIERAAPLAVGLDINELTPAYDRGETALLAARLAREFIAATAKAKN